MTKQAKQSTQATINYLSITIAEIEAALNDADLYPTVDSLKAVAGPLLDSKQRRWKTRSKIVAAMIEKAKQLKALHGLGKSQDAPLVVESKPEPLVESVETLPVVESENTTTKQSATTQAENTMNTKPLSKRAQTALTYIQNGGCFRKHEGTYTLFDPHGMWIAGFGHSTLNELYRHGLLEYKMNHMGEVIYLRKP